MNEVRECSHQLGSCGFDCCVQVESENCQGHRVSRELSAYPERKTAKYFSEIGHQ